VGKASYRRQLVTLQSAKLIAAYAYAGCDWHESTIDVVMSGHQLIAANGRMYAERPPFARGSALTWTDIDVAHLRHDRRRDSNRVTRTDFHTVDMAVPISAPALIPQVDAYPFLPQSENEAERRERLAHIINIQAHGLAQRIHATHGAKLHLGLSGGLDSTLAFLVACRAAEIVDTPVQALLQTYTMPAVASSERTQHNAVTLATLHDVASTVIPIADLVQQQLMALGHDGVTQDVTYENVQARLRTSILFNMANLHGGMVLGTGDLSEIALGWCTFNGDHMSHYHVNAGVPKTLVRHLVAHVAAGASPEIQACLHDILATPISPELTTTGDGTVSQKTEDIIGPYELHDFFLYHFVRWGDPPAKIAWLASHAFADVYPKETIEHWLSVFVRRFVGSQFKRSVMPDGPKVGSVALSPRGDWRMPADLYNAGLWQ
jgi:NAD+ synthase (glutamine-hydrolysing)